jgi:hypothetical protein
MLAFALMGNRSWNPKLTFGAAFLAGSILAYSARAWASCADRREIATLEIVSVTVDGVEQDDLSALSPGAELDADADGLRLGHPDVAGGFYAR